MFTPGLIMLYSPSPGNVNLCKFAIFVVNKKSLYIILYIYPYFQPLIFLVVLQVVRAYCFLNHPIPNTNNSQSVQIIIPQNQVCPKRKSGNTGLYLGHFRVARRHAGLYLGHFRVARRHALWGATAPGTSQNPPCP
jgi:hypothetical protein